MQLFTCLSSGVFASGVARVKIASASSSVKDAVMTQSANDISSEVGVNEAAEDEKAVGAFSRKVDKRRGWS